MKVMIECTEQEFYAAKDALNNIVEYRDKRILKYLGTNFVALIDLRRFATKFSRIKINQLVAQHDFTILGDVVEKIVKQTPHVNPETKENCSGSLDYSFNEYSYYCCKCKFRITNEEIANADTVKKSTLV